MTDTPKIIIPNKADEGAEREVRILQRLYETNKELHDLADKIHSSRMLPPPACENCIWIAMVRLGITIDLQMTDHEMRIAIAKACGWKFTHETCALGTITHASKDGCPPDCVPDYCGDLNAMYEAEEWLLKQSREQPMEELLVKYDWYLNEAGMCIKFHATAKERAKAFLKALGRYHQ